MSACRKALRLSALRSVQVSGAPREIIRRCEDLKLTHRAVFSDPSFRSGSWKSLAASLAFAVVRTSTAFHASTHRESTGGFTGKTRSTAASRCALASLPKDPYFRTSGERSFCPRFSLEQSAVQAEKVAPVVKRAVSRPPYPWRTPCEVLQRDYAPHRPREIRPECHAPVSAPTRFESTTQLGQGIISQGIIIAPCAIRLR